MLAHAFLSVMTAAPARPGRRHCDEADRELISLTRNQNRRLFTGLLCCPRPASDQLRWSRWRRHQATARNCHHQHRQALA